MIHEPKPGLNWFRYAGHPNWDVVLVDWRGKDGLAKTLSFTNIHANSELVSNMYGEWGGCFAPEPAEQKPTP